MDAFEVAHVVVGYRNQHSGDGLENRKEERGLRNTIKKEYYFQLTATIQFSFHFILHIAARVILLKDVSDHVVSTFSPPQFLVAIR